MGGGSLMRGPRRRCRLRFVESPRLIVTLELELGAEPIAGRLRGYGDELEFAGWLGLAAALERLLDESEPPGAD
jgi:hypothetical protein